MIRILVTILFTAIMHGSYSELYDIYLPLEKLYKWPVTLLEPYLLDEFFFESTFFLETEEFFILSPIGTLAVYGLFYVALLLFTLRGNKKLTVKKANTVKAHSSGMPRIKIILA